MKKANILSKDEIREIFLSNGFRIKEGEIDLMPYVYLSAEALINKTLDKILKLENVNE